MARPKKSTVASRTNGSIAKNKGSIAPKTPKVDVLTCNVFDGRVVFHTEKRAKAPKGTIHDEDDYCRWYIRTAKQRMQLGPNYERNAKDPFDVQKMSYKEAQEVVQAYAAFRNGSPVAP